jgi:hypothetical protein
VRNRGAAPKAFGVSGDIRGYAVNVDAAGNIVVTGTASGSVDFGGGTMTSVGTGSDLVVATFDGGGTLRWAKIFSAPAGSPDDLHGLTIAAGPTCHVLVAGGVQGALDLGGVPLNSGTAHDVFVAELVP